jgi:hypothetical protein
MHCAQLAERNAIGNPVTKCIQGPVIFRCPLSGGPPRYFIAGDEAFQIRLSSVPLKISAPEPDQ